MSRSEGYALLIGVNDYSAYDASVGNPEGKSDLLGSLNDVLAFFRTCRDLDIPAANIRVLTSPRLDASRLPGVPAENIGEATEQAILKGSAWLADALAAGGGGGLFTFSGHGDRRGGELLLCPADTAGPEMQRAVPFEALRSIFAQRGALDGLTCVIDACFAGAALDASAPRQRRVLSLRERATDQAGGGVASTIAAGDGSRVLAAAMPGQPAFQARFSGEHRGAFSWAVGAALDQWSRVRDADGTRVNLTYGELRARAEGLLRTLSFDQAPVLAGPENVGELAFLQRGSAPKRTSPQPDAPRLAMQVDPIFNNWGKYVGTINSNTIWEIDVIAGGNVGTYSANTEYWDVNQDQLGNLGSYSLSFTLTDGGTTAPSPPTFTHQQNFTEAVNLTWTAMTGDPGSGGSLYVNGSGSIYLRINTDGGSPPKITKVTWYQVIATGTSPANVSPTGTFTTTNTVSVGARQTAYYIAHNV
jgi:hypothetical protein